MSQGQDPQLKLDRVRATFDRLHAAAMLAPDGDHVVIPIPEWTALCMLLAPWLPFGDNPFQQ